MLKVGDFGVGSTGALTTKTNFDTTTTAGSYYIASGSAVTGSPITATNQGILVVEGKTVGGRIIQTWHYISSSSVDYHSDYRRSYTGSAWTPWAKSHHTGNILAPVSESAGVPTGGVIESGTGYVKYADGTMICHARVDTGTLNYTADGSVFRCPNQTWTYPVTFVGIPTVSACPSSLASWYLWAGCGTPSTTSIPYFLFAGIAGSLSSVVSLTAVGRWF